MKRNFLRITTLLLAVIFSTLCFFACDSGSTEVKVTATVVHAEDGVLLISVDETDGKATAFDVLSSLQKENKITFEYTTSDKGAYLTGINGKTEGDGAYWMFYTTDTENVYTEYPYTYNEVTYNSAASGVSSFVVKTGEKYLFVLQSF